MATADARQYLNDNFATNIHCTDIFEENMVPLRLLGENMKEVKPKIFSGDFVEKALFLREFLVMVFGDKIKQESEFNHIDMLSTEKAGVSLLELALALTGTPASIEKEKICILGGGSSCADEAAADEAAVYERSSQVAGLV